MFEYGGHLGSCAGWCDGECRDSYERQKRRSIPPRTPEQVAAGQRALQNALMEIRKLGAWSRRNQKKIAEQCAKARREEVREEIAIRQQELYGR